MKWPQYGSQQKLVMILIMILLSLQQFQFYSLLLDSLLFKLITTPEKETALLTIPEMCTDKIIRLYHSGPFWDSRCNKDIIANS